MLFFYEKLSTSTKMGVFTNADPYVATYAITPNEISFTGCYADVSAVSAGINAGNPATFTLEFSRDGGVVWNPIVGVSADPIISANQFLVEAGGQVLVGPLMRLTITPPAGESLTLTEVGVRRIRPGMVATLLSYGAGGGGLGDVGVFYQRGPGGAFANTKPVYDTTTPANNRPWPVTLVPDSGNPSSAVSSTAGVLTAPSPLYGFAGFQALTAWDVTTAARAEVSGTSFGKAAPGDSQAIDSLNYLYNPIAATWSEDQCVVLDSAAWYVHAAASPAAKHTISVTQGFDVFTGVRSEIGATQIGKGGAIPDSAAMDCLSYAYNPTLAGWVYDAVEVLDHSVQFIQIAPAPTARYALSAMCAWDGVTRRELVTEDIGVGAKHTLNLTPTKALPAASVMIGWDLDTTTHTEAEIWTTAAARYDFTIGKFLATSPMIGFDETNLDHREVKITAEGNVTTSLRWERDAAEQEIVEDTVNPGVNRPLPVQAMANNATAGGFAPLSSTFNNMLKVQESATVGGTLYHSYLATPVDTVNWQEISAGIGNDVTRMEIFDSSGELLELGLGAAGAEARHIFIMPGGNGANGNPTIVDIPTGTRISIRAVSAAASDGFIAINWYYG
jgi:hypothetical protein